MNQKSLNLFLNGLANFRDLAADPFSRVLPAIDCSARRCLAYTSFAHTGTTTPRAGSATSSCWRFSSCSAWTAPSFAGIGLGVAGAKLVAVSLGIVLHLRHVHGVVAMLTLVYVTAAILPWTALFFLR